MFEEARKAGYRAAKFRGKLHIQKVILDSDATSIVLMLISDYCGSCVYLMPAEYGARQMIHVRPIDLNLSSCHYGEMRIVFGLSLAPSTLAFAVNCLPMHLQLSI